ncbi:ketosteroid isomerase [Pullulanibacillus camelliae]|uniref:Ketosteroid isomerase n=2 Tax=Pullulanibacillus camelliae TaxID=1707096 RepID=A0A8J3DXG1_9BACL|nr:ketosteroid isomerase [Pullulanibacillus camelliae]
MPTNLNSVEEVFTIYKSAVYEKNVERLLSIYSSHIHIYDCWGEWECRGISQWREKVEEWFAGLQEEGVDLQTDFTDVVIEEAPNLAFAHCNLLYAAYNPSGEKLRHITNRFTFCLRKEKHAWYITHEHSSLPIDMETGKGLFRLK